MIEILRWVDVWCFHCQRHAYRPERDHAYVCKTCQGGTP